MIKQIWLNSVYISFWNLYDVWEGKMQVYSLNYSKKLFGFSVVHCRNNFKIHVHVYMIKFHPNKYNLYQGFTILTIDQSSSVSQSFIRSDWLNQEKGIERVPFYIHHSLRNQKYIIQISETESSCYFFFMIQNFCLHYFSSETKSSEFHI